MIITVEMSITSNRSSMRYCLMDFKTLLLYVLTLKIVWPS